MLPPMGDSTNTPDDVLALAQGHHRADTPTKGGEIVEIDQDLEGRAWGRLIGEDELVTADVLARI